MREKTAVLVFFIAILAAPGFAARQRAIRERVQLPPHVPACSQVRGLPNIFFSLDGGETFSGNAEPQFLASTWGIAILEDTPNVLIASVGTGVYDSTDAGCNWNLRYTITEQIHHPLHVTPATGGRAFVWAEEFVFRYDGGAVAKIAIPEQIGGLGVDPANREHVRVIGLMGGAPWESFDGGATWARFGIPVGGFVTAVAFDPSNFNHMIVGTSPTGLVVTTDAGRTWRTSSDVPSSRPVCEVAFAGGSPNVVWALLAVRSDRNFVYRSTDGGNRYESLPATIDVENDVCLPLTAHPADANLATIPYRSMHTVNAATRSMVKSTCCGDGISRIVYSPVDPRIMYVFSTTR